MHNTSADGMDSLSLQEKAKLAKILSRLSSDFANERDSAALLATAFVNKRNLKWSDLPEMLVSSSTPSSSTSKGRPLQDRRQRGAIRWKGYDRRHANRFGSSLDMSA